VDESNKAFKLRQRVIPPLDSVSLIEKEDREGPLSARGEDRNAVRRARGASGGGDGFGREGKPMSVDKKKVGFAASSNENQSSDGEGSGLLEYMRNRRNSSSSNSEIISGSGGRRGSKNSGTLGQSKRPALDYSSLIKNSVGGGRMTLRDLELSLPVENNNLDSDEDPEDYLKWLEEEELRIKET
jgi:hypothetical protein